MSRKKYTIAQLDEKLIKTFKNLFTQGRYDPDKIHSLGDIFAFARYVGLKSKEKYLAIETLLNSAKISDAQISTSDVWTFSLYQTLRQIEIKEYDKHHVYTSLVGKKNTINMTKSLNNLMPNWIDNQGKIQAFK